MLGDDSSDSVDVLPTVDISDTAEGTVTVEASKTPTIPGWVWLALSTAVIYLMLDSDDET